MSATSRFAGAILLWIVLLPGSTDAYTISSVLTPGCHEQLTSEALRGKTDVSLPVYSLRIGQAIHAVEDSFTHTYRTADGMKITAVMKRTRDPHSSAARQETPGCREPSSPCSR